MLHLLLGKKQQHQTQCLINLFRSVIKKTHENSEIFFLILKPLLLFIRHITNLIPKYLNKSTDGLQAQHSTTKKMFTVEECKYITISWNLNR